MIKTAKKVAKKATSVSRSSTVRVVKGVHKTATTTKATAQKVKASRPYQKTKQASKKVHHHVAKKPHEKLMSKGKRYAKWHSWNYKGIHHGHVHGVVATAWTFIVVSVFVANTLTTTALSTWSQTDWSGGQGSSTANQFASKDNIDIGEGSFSITPDEKLINGNFEEGLDGWSYIPSEQKFASKQDYPAGSTPGRLSSGDVNGDGRQDMVIPNTSDNTISVFINNGDGTFAPKVDFATGSAPYTVELGDIDSDGDLDAITANNGSATISVIKNDGYGNFSSKVDYPSMSNIQYATPFDADGDGDLDVAASGGSSVGVYTNNGTGVLSSRYSASGGNDGRHITAADFDSDGDIDLIVSKYGEGRIYLFWNNGTFLNLAGNGINTTALTTGSGPNGTVAADFDSDGDIDIISINRSSGTISVFRNNGNNTFAAKVDYAVAGSSQHTIVARDFDNDGDLDLATANRASSNVSVLLNNGDATFESAKTFATGSETNGVVASDVNEDGLVDIVTSNYSGSMSVLLNITDQPLSDSDHFVSPTHSVRVSSSTYPSILYQDVQLEDGQIAYSLSAHVYADDNVVSGDDAVLFASGSSVSTTYTNVGNGWYRLSAIITGQDLEQKYGIQIAPNRVLFIDNFSLRHYTAGTLTSNAQDTELGSAWGNLTYASSGTGTVAVKARTSNNADMSGAPAFAGCAPVTSGADLTNESCVTDNHRYIQYEVTLTGEDGQTPVFEDISIEYSPYDNDPPEDNAADIVMKKSAGGSTVNENDWTNGISPYFEWSSGADEGTGVKGYCLYLGTDSTADPVTTKGVLGSSPVNTEGTCQFAVAENYIDTATNGYLATALTSSNTPYYLNIKAIDNAHNVYDGDSAKFHFRFDNTPPSNPGYITAPSQFVSNKEVTLTWPTNGNDSAKDAHSGLTGLQYRIGSGGVWYGDDHSGDQDSSDVLDNDGSYTTVNPPDFDNIQEGNNVVYFRSWDNAGNVSSTYVTTVIKFNSSSPSSPLNVTATPAANTTNSFAFSWSAPSSYQGSASSLAYCYSVNTLPNENTCTFTAAGVTSLPAGPYATQPGANTFYVVARDEAGNINYATAASETFTANTSAPGIPLDTEIADVSTRATNSWKLALSWSEPSNTGAGIASYRIYRSTDNSNFTQVASTAGISHVDTGLNQQQYYYKVRACDSANNCGAYSSTVNKLPTGRFTSPANLVSPPAVTNVTTKRAKISWSTDRNSDSKVAIGKASGQYSASEVGNSAQVTAHSIELDNLEAGTLYYLKARWTDEDGNTGSSNEFTFRTSPAPYIKELKVTKTSLDSAVIRFTSKDAHKAVIRFGKTEAFGGQVEINTSTQESSYDITLPSLDDGTKYYFRTALFDNEGGEYQGDLYSFTTPPRPRISELRFEPVEGEPTSTQRVTWRTNVPASSSISYRSDTEAAKELQHSELKTEHDITIKDLKDDSTYIIVASSRDAGGNLAVSDEQRITTALDTRPPKIRDVKVETSIKGTGAEARGQIIVSWKTDEPATSQVSFGQGSGLKSFNNRTSEDTGLGTEHIVIVSDLPTSTVYTVQPVSKDRSGNGASGNSKSAIIGRASDSIISIVLNTLRGVFGF